MPKTKPRKSVVPQLEIPNRGTRERQMRDQNLLNSARVIQTNLDKISGSRNSDPAVILNHKVNLKIITDQLLREKRIQNPKKPIPAQLFRYNERGEVVLGRKFMPIYFKGVVPIGKNDTPENRRAFYKHQLEQFIVSNPSQHSPNKETGSLGNIPASAVENLAIKMRKKHKLQKPTWGSTLPIDAQNAVFAIYRMAKPGEVMPGLRVAYAIYKVSDGLVVHPDLIDRLLNGIDSHSKKPKRIKVSWIKSNNAKNISEMHEKMKWLEQLEKNGKFPWKQMRFSAVPGKVGLMI